VEPTRTTTESSAASGQVRCVDGTLPDDVDLNRLFPEPPGDVTMINPNHSLTIAEGYEEQEVRLYERSDRESYYVYITRWNSTEVAENQTTNSLFPSANSGKISVAVLSDGENTSNETYETLMTSIPCISESDISVGLNQTLDLETSTPRPDPSIEIEDIEIETGEQRFDDEYPVERVSVFLVNEGEVELSDYTIVVEVGESESTFLGSEEVGSGEEVVVSDESAVGLLTLSPGENRVTVSITVFGEEISRKTVVVER
jgi:hypothetical protein